MINIFNVLSALLRSLYYIKRFDDSVNNQNTTWNNQNYENEKEVLDHEDENHKWEDFIKDEEDK